MLPSPFTSAKKCPHRFLLNQYRLAIAAKEYQRAAELLLSAYYAGSVQAKALLFQKVGSSRNLLPKVLNEGVDYFSQGMCYAAGIKGEMSQTLAREYFARGSKQEGYRHRYKCTLMYAKYLQKDAVDLLAYEDERQAHRKFRRAALLIRTASLFCDYAKIEYGLCLADGYGVKKNREAAIKLLKHSDLPLALYYCGSNMIESDKPEMIHLGVRKLQQAAQLDFLTAQMKLMYYYSKGIVVNEITYLLPKISLAKRMFKRVDALCVHPMIKMMFCKYIYEDSILNILKEPSYAESIVNHLISLMKDSTGSARLRRDAGKLLCDFMNERNSLFFDIYLAHVQKEELLEVPFSTLLLRQARRKKLIKQLNLHERVLYGDDVQIQFLLDDEKPKVAQSTLSYFSMGAEHDSASEKELVCKYEFRMS